jgi:hypothetical protein
MRRSDGCGGQKFSYPETAAHAGNGPVRSLIKKRELRGIEKGNTGALILDGRR